MDYEFITYEKKDHVAHLTMNRPEVRNALHPPAHHEMSQALDDFAAGEAQIIVFTGGTGISRRDRTYDVISRALEKTLPGFGEIFRLLSYEEIGAAAMLSRATAGVYKETVVVSTPGSTNAVRLAMEKLILPESQHLAWELTR